MENILSGKKRKRPKQDTLDPTNSHTDMTAYSQNYKFESESHQNRINECESVKSEEKEDTNMQNLTTLNKEPQAQNIKQIPNTTLLEWPDEDTLIECF